MHLRGICELRDLVNIEHRSADGEDFSTTMSEMHKQIKQILQYTTNNYKQRANS